MKIITQTAPNQNGVVEFTGAELKKFYVENGSFFICSAIKAEYWRKFGFEMHPTSESVILSLRQAVPSRFRKTDPKSCKNVLGAWLLSKYANSARSREHTIQAVPDSFVFTIPMFTQQQY